jgi:hypothetical protein
MMKATGLLTFFFVVWLLVGGAPLAFGEPASFVSLAVQTKLSFPSDPVFPAELAFNADFVPADEVNLLTNDVSVTFWPPDPCPPPGPCESNWKFSLPAGCFVRRDTGPWRVAEGSCEARLTRTAADQTENDLTDHLVSWKGKVEPPTKTILAYRMRLKVSFMLDEGTTYPPQPIGGRTELMVGEQVCEACHSQVKWQGTQELQR